MAKPYSQDFSSDRVIEAVERGKLSAPGGGPSLRGQRIGGHQVAGALLKRHGSREPVGHGGHRASKLMPHRDFPGGRAGREIGRHASGPLRSPFRPSEGSKPTPQ